MDETQAPVTFEQAEQALLRAVIDCAEGGDAEEAREAAEAIAILRHARGVGPAGGAASPDVAGRLRDLSEILRPAPQTPEPAAAAGQSTQEP